MIFSVSKGRLREAIESHLPATADAITAGYRSTAAVALTTAVWDDLTGGGMIHVRPADLSGAVMHWMDEADCPHEDLPCRSCVAAAVVADLSRAGDPS